VELIFILVIARMTHGTCVELTWGLAYAQSKDGLECITEGCTGRIKLAVELQFEENVETRKVLFAADEPKKAVHPPPKKEQPAGRKQREKPAQRPPPIDAGEQQALRQSTDWMRSKTAGNSPRQTQ